MRKMKILLSFMLVFFIGLMGFDQYKLEQERLENERIHKKLVEMRLDAQSIKEDYIAKKKEEERVKKLNEDYLEYLVEGWKSDEWKELEEWRYFKRTYGLDIDKATKMTFHLSFYSDLNCENGYGNLTASGKILRDGMVANNFLPFGTKIFLEGHGMKTVEDRGSKKYFNTIQKLDVLVPRYGGESEGAYYRRVNNMGRKSVTGYLFS